MNYVKGIIIRYKRRGTDIRNEDIISKCDGYDKSMRFVDASLSHLCIIDPTLFELEELNLRIEKTMKQWRFTQISITKKAHLLECCAYHQTKASCRLGYKTEHHIEKSSNWRYR